MEEPPEVSLVVPAYNEERYLPDCLDAIGEAVRAAGASAEVIVADDGSTDRTAELARARGARVVRAGGRNIAAARNAGAAAARGRLLLFVDADTRINAPLLGATLAAFRTGLVCGGGATGAFPNASPGTRAVMRLSNALLRFARYAAGAYLFARADAFRAVRGFDARVYATEEIGFSMRLARWGRAHGMRFVILRASYLTSDRKLAELPSWTILRAGIRLLRRERLRSRAECAIWYDVRREEARLPEGLPVPAGDPPPDERGRDPFRRRTASPER